MQAQLTSTHRQQDGHSSFGCGFRCEAHGLLLLVGVLVVGLVTAIALFLSKKGNGKHVRREATRCNRLGSVVLTLGELRRITKDFSDDQLVGKGAFGKVYKGVLTNGDMIAVKRFASTITGLQDVHYENEAQHLMRLKHPNIVRLVGYCSETEVTLVRHNGTFVRAEETERLLCLEYMPKGSLFDHLSESSGLDWNTRYKIIEGICYGLHYLHEEWQVTPIIHRDLKPANILLDDNMVPKIADFGLSRLFGEDQTRTCTISCKGTLGYMAPEYLEKGVITKMFDIFSLGVIIIEIITGLKGYPTDETETTSHQYIDRVLNDWRNRLREAQGTSQDIDYQQIKKCIQIGLLCVKFDPVKRPTINQIIKMLGRSDEAYQNEREIESRNSGLEMQSINNKGLMEELDKLLERLRIPQEFAASLTGGSFEESRMPKNVEACEWLTGAIRSLEVPNLDPCYVNVHAVREKKAELEKLKTTFVRRASEFLWNYFSSLVDFMISDKSYFSQRGQLKWPDHADLRYKCRTYARLLQHLKSLDKSCLGPLRKAYCHSLNLLLRREAREFANELRASTVIWFRHGNPADTSTVSDAYSKMLTIFIPLLVDESFFFEDFMCFEVPALVPAGSPISNKSKSGGNDADDDLGLMDPDGNDLKPDSTSAELGTLNEALQELLDGIQEDFYAIVDWTYKIDPLRCISVHGITERYLSGQKADAAGFVRKLLDDLESRISVQFSRFIDEACHQIERNERNVLQTGIVAYIPRFAVLASRMEQYIQGQSRDLIDKAYTKLVSTMFATLEKIAQSDPKTADIVLIENYAAFQYSHYDLANVVPTLAKFYLQASKSYELACTRHISSLIYLQFERLFQFNWKVEALTYAIAPEEIPFQLGLSKTDLRRVLKSSLSGIDKSIGAMYRRLQKTLTSDELFPLLWDKCKKEFLDKYESFVQMVTQIYGNEPIMSVNEMKEVLAKF